MTLSQKQKQKTLSNKNVIGVLRKRTECSKSRCYRCYDQCDLSDEKVPATVRAGETGRKEVSFSPARSNATEEVCMTVYLDFHRQFVGKEGSIHRCPLPIVFLTYPALSHDAPDLLLLTESKAAVCS